MSYEIKQRRVEKLLNFALVNLFFFRAKSISLDLKDHRFAQPVIFGACPDYFPQYKGKIVRLNDQIVSDDVYETAKLLIEQLTTPARHDIECPKPYSPSFNYIGLRLQELAKFPCPILISSIAKDSSTFYLQFTAQNLEGKLETLRKELDIWNANRSSFNIKLPSSGTYTI